MRKLSALLPVLFFALVSTGQPAAQLPASVTLVRAARLLDPRTGNVLSPAAVLIESGLKTYSLLNPPSQHWLARRHIMRKANVPADK